MNREEFVRHWKRLEPKVLQSCTSLLKCPHTAKDATQDIFLKAYTELDSFNEECQIGTWVFTITRNHCIDLLRRSKRLREITVIEQEEDYALFLEYKCEIMQKVFQTLPAKQVLTLNLAYVDERTYAELASTVGLSESAIKMRVVRAKQHARAIYNELCHAQIL